MKFRNGHWLYKEGYACFSPRQVYEITRKDDALELCAPTSLITGKDDTLKGVNLTITEKMAGSRNRSKETILPETSESAL